LLRPADLPLSQIHKTGKNRLSIKIVFRIATALIHLSTSLAAQNDSFYLILPQERQKPHTLNQAVFHFPLVIRVSVSSPKPFSDGRPFPQRYHRVGWFLISRSTSDSTRIADALSMIRPPVSHGNAQFAPTTSLSKRPSLFDENTTAVGRSGHASTTTSRRSSIVCVHHNVSKLFENSSALHFFSLLPNQFDTIGRSQRPSGSLSRHIHTTPRILDRPQRRSQFFLLGSRAGTWRLCPP
jgi:hypothetical protein